MFHKEGHKIILVTFTIVAITCVLAHFYIEPIWLEKSIQAIALIFLVLILQFFRNQNVKQHQTTVTLLLQLTVKLLL